MAGIDGYLTEAAVQQVSDWLDDDEGRNAVTEHNYRIARHHFSYERLQEKLDLVMEELSFGRPAPVTARGPEYLEPSFDPTTSGAERSMWAKACN
jgi:hypothetical protein